MPLLQTDVIRRMIDAIADEDALIPMIEQRWQPMHAIYKKKALPTIERLVNEPDSFLPDLRDAINATYIEPKVFESISDWRLSFVSFNDMETVEQYRRYLTRSE